MGGMDELLKQAAELKNELEARFKGSSLSFADAVISIARVMLIAEATERADQDWRSSFDAIEKRFPFLNRDSGFSQSGDDKLHGNL